MNRPVVVLLPLLVLASSNPLHRPSHHHVHHHSAAKQHDHAAPGRETGTKRQEGMEPWPKCCSLNSGNSHTGAQGCPSCNCGEGSPMSMDGNNPEGGEMGQESASKRQEGMEPWPKCCKMNAGNSAGGAHGCTEKYGGGNSMSMGSSDAESIDMGQEGASMHHEGGEPWPKCCKLNSGSSVAGAHGCPESGAGTPMSMDNSDTESTSMGQESASKRQEGMEPWPKCCNLNDGNSVGRAHGCQESSSGTSNGYINSDPTSSTTSDTIDICPSGGEEHHEEEEQQQQEEGSKRNAVEPWPKCCRLNGGKSGGGKNCPCNCGGSIMSSKGSFMDNGNSYMNDKNGYMDDKGSDMNGKMSYMEEKSPYMNDDKTSYMGGKDSYMNDKNSFMNGRNSYMNDKNSYMGNDKNSYMNDKNSDMTDGDSDMEGKSSFMDDREPHGSFKSNLRNNSLVDSDNRNSYMEKARPLGFKAHDYDTHTVTKACEGDYKECNQGWNACKTPCFGVFAGSTVRESDQNDLNTVKAIAAMDTAKTVNMLGRNNGVQVATGASQDREPTSAEIQENDTKIAQALSFNKLTGGPAEGKGMVQTGGQAVEPYKVKVSQGPVIQGPKVTI